MEDIYPEVGSTIQVVPKTGWVKVKHGQDTECPSQEVDLRIDE